VTDIAGRFTKQPGETLDYVVQFGPWFANRLDLPVSFTATAEAGITVAASSRSGTNVTVVLSGGVDGGRYKVTVRLTTNATPAIVKEIEFTVRVRET